MAWRRIDARLKRCRNICTNSTWRRALCRLKSSSLLSASTRTASEHIFDPELEDPWRARLSRDLAEVASVEIDSIGVAAAAEWRARIAPVEVIQQIERFHPEFDVLRGAKRNPTR